MPNYFAAQGYKLNEVSVQIICAYLSKLIWETAVNV